jgi:uncharacterized protein YkwD
MESFSPARALLATGASLALLVGAAAAAPVPGSTGPSPAGDPARTTSATSMVAGPSAHPAARRTTKRWAGSISVHRRSAVESAYLRSFASGMDTPTGFTGSDAACRPGTTSAASRAATLRAVNFARAMSGLAPVRFSSTLNARSQRTALMMSANQMLSHSPSRSWRCWSRVGAANAGRSNLALSYPSITSAGVVALYLGEPGSDNSAVGHRRWLLNPFATQMGTGSTGTANAMTVIGPTASRRPNPAWVSWPSAGWFPDALEPGGLWSLSAGNSQMDFRRAGVRVHRNGQAVRVRKQRVQDGYAQPTLAWKLPPSIARSGTFTVVVRGIHRAGTRKTFGRTWTVRMFTPSG